MRDLKRNFWQNLVIDGHLLRSEQKLSGFLNKYFKAMQNESSILVVVDSGCYGD